MVQSLEAVLPNQVGCFRDGAGEAVGTPWGMGVAVCVILLWVHAGIVFEELTGSNMSYKIRLRQEVGELDSWHTTRVRRPLQSSGPSITNRLSLWWNCCCVHHDNRIHLLMLIFSQHDYLETKQTKYSNHHLVPGHHQISNLMMARSIRPKHDLFCL